MGMGMGMRIGRGTGWLGGLGAQRPGAPGQPRLAPGAPGASGAKGSSKCQGLRLSVCLGMSMGTSQCLSLSFGRCFCITCSAGRRGGAPIGVWHAHVATGGAWQRRAPDSAPAHANSLLPWHSGSSTAVAHLLPLLPGGNSKAAFLHSCYPPTLARLRVCPCPSPSKVFCEIAGHGPEFFFY